MTRCNKYIIPFESELDKYILRVPQRRQMNFNQSHSQLFDFFLNWKVFSSISLCSTFQNSASVFCISLSVFAFWCQCWVKFLNENYLNTDKHWWHLGLKQNDKKPHNIYNRNVKWIFIFLLLQYYIISNSNCREQQPFKHKIDVSIKYRYICIILSRVSSII